LSVGYELGPAFLLPDGRAFYLGASGHTAFYTLSTNSWTAGPDIPGGRGADDAPGAMMPNGDILFAADTPLYSGPTHIYEFNPIANTYTDVTPSDAYLSNPAYVTRMLMLPSGQVLFADSSNQLRVYTPSGSPQSAWQPTISSVVQNGSNYTLTGTQLNGMSAGASYGDDAEMDTNYPIIELNNGSGTVYFARTFGWSSTGVATGSTSVTTNFSLPAGIPSGTYSLCVIANGIASNPFSFTVGGDPPSADLALRESGPSSAHEGDNNIRYTLTVTNGGPNAASNTVLTDTLDPNMKFVSATTSQGSISHSGSVVTFTIGTVNNGGTVTATVTVQATEDGSLTNSGSVTSSTPDPNSSNNTASATTSVSEPSINVSGPINTNNIIVNNLRVATFTHANGVEPASAFSATINWGDGTTGAGTIAQSGNNYTVTGSHTYSSGGSHRITTTVVESGNAPRSPAKSGPTTPTGHGGASSSSIVVLAPSTPAGGPQRFGTAAQTSDTGPATDSTANQELVMLLPGLTTTAKKKGTIPQGPRALFAF
jgi:uncharacterized repeat protein (TIGR01451 family)